MLSCKPNFVPCFFLLVFALPLFFINIHNGHSWGDDFSQYIKEAQNIATGKPYYQSNYIFNKYNAIYAPPQYPPGFALLLAPVVRFWGLSFITICYFNSLLASCLLFALFAYFRNRNVGTLTSVCLAVMATYSHYVLDMKGCALADIPCLLFITLYLAWRESATYSWPRILLLIVFAAMAIQIRSQGVFLMAAEAVLFFFSLGRILLRKQKTTLKEILLSPPLIIIAGVMMLNLFLNKVVFYTPLSTTSFYNDFIQTALNGSLTEVVREHFIYLFKVVSAFFYQEASVGFFNAAGFIIGCAGVVFAVLGFIASVSKRFTFDDFFFIIMCGLIIYYPVRDQRYFLPALPVLFYYCYAAFKAILPAILRIDYRLVAILLTVLYLRSEYSYIKTLDSPFPAGFIPKEADTIAFGYIKDHVNDSDIIVFTKPRALTLFTNKRTMNASWQSPETDKKIFDSMQVKYILVLDGMDDRYFTSYLREVQHPVDSVKIADGYELYTLR